MASGKRTPFGKFDGKLKDIKPNDLSVLSAKGLLEAHKISSQEIDHVIFANVLPSTTDTIYGARHIALKIGAKLETPGYTVNRLCGSGIQAIVDARNLIQSGEAHCVLATGSENMSLAPHLTYGTRFGSKHKAFTVVDMLWESLNDEYCGTPMAITAENLATKYSITRDACEEFAVNSHLKVQKHLELLDGELVPVTVRKDVLKRDEHARADVNKAEMAKLKSSFKEGGTVTPATASGVVDGAASVLVCSEEFLKKHGLEPLAEIGDYTVVGVEPKEMGFGPVPAIQKLLSKTGTTLKDIDLVEINEAFAAQTLACAKVLELDLAKLNVWGGATAIGHPLGASGLRISLTLARQLKHYNKNLGIASACIGGGQGIALQLKRV